MPNKDIVFIKKKKKKKNLSSKGSLVLLHFLS